MNSIIQKIHCVDSPKSVIEKEQLKTDFNSVITYKAFKNLDVIRSEWRVLTNGLSIFFSYEFLKAVENCPPSGLQNRYLICYKNDIPYGILCIQLKAFRAQESIQFKKKSGVFNSVSNSIKGGFSKLINLEGLVCGSVLLTGNYAYHFLDDTITHKDSFLLAEKLIEDYRQELNQNGHNINITFLKDFYANKKLENHNINESKFKEFSVQPNMILKIKPEWKKYEDYLNAFQSKYRVRAKRARKKLEGIERKELDFVDIKKYNVEIYNLYRNIVDNINFNLFLLNEDYFSELKKQLKEKFRLFAYFKDDRMIAFYTCIDNDTEMNAHFLGYNPSENQEHQLYLNSLYDMVELSLMYNFKTINFSRTAMEIKSSVGAEPQDMYCYLKHQNKIVNLGVAKIVDVLNPTEEWTPRNPFKD